MSDSSNQPSTSVDDVRRVRERIALHHGGNLRQHREETNRIFEELRHKLNLKLAEPPDPPPHRNTIAG